MKFLGVILFGIAVFGLAQKMAKKDGKSIWNDTAGKRGSRDLFLDEGDEYLSKSVSYFRRSAWNLVFDLYSNCGGIRNDNSKRFKSHWLVDSYWFSWQC